MAIENFFDYFDDVTIDLTDYNDENNIEYTNIQPIIVTMQSLYKFINSTDLSKYDEYCYDYNLGDYERPDLLSRKLYNTTDFWWVNLLLNNNEYNK